MARPRVIQLEHGTVSLQGFPKEVADKLADYIKAFSAPTIVIPAGQPLEAALEEVEETPALSLVDLPSRAIGVYKGQGNDHRLVTVAYNVDTKQAMVESEQKCVGSRDSSMQFKIAADKHKFIV